MMKKIILLTFLGLATNIYAQQTFGLTVGGQTTGITDAKIGDNQNQYGFYVGGYYNLPFDQGFSFQPEIMYSFQSFNNLNITYSEYFGGIKNQETTQPRFDFKYQMHLIKLPLLLKYQPNKLYVELGPEFSYLMSAKGNYHDKSNEIPALNGKIENINHFQAALVTGAGYQLNEKLNVGLRLSWGFTEFSEYSYIKNFNVGVGVNYRLN